MNASLVGVIEEARERGFCHALYGARFGLPGILAEDFVDLLAQPAELLRAIHCAPASALGSSRYEASQEDLSRILDILAARDIRFFFYTGGNGSMGTAQELDALAQCRGYELQVVGIPKTIDNDLRHTDHTPGFASAARFAACAVRDIGADNLALPNQVEIVEILGRNAGWLAASTALARRSPGDAPHLIYFPETRLPLPSFLADVRRVYSQHNRCVVAVCEGQLDQDGQPFGADVRKGSRGALAQNLAHRLALLVTKELGLRARSEKPGLLGRSSQEHALRSDREEAYACGRAAVVAAAKQHGGTMVTLQCTRQPYQFSTGLVGLSEVALLERTLPQEYRSPAGNDVTTEFLSYIAPLVGEITKYPGLV
jgi:6-phosphofructokinase 1